MNNPLAIETGLHWMAVMVYVLATLFTVYGVFFKKEKAERRSFYLAFAGLLIHGVAILYRWNIVGHGPYMARYEVLSADAWILMATFLITCRMFRVIRPLSVFIFPATFLIVALGLFCNPAINTLPPTFRSIWLILHVLFYKVATATIILAATFSFLYILKTRSSKKWLERLPALDIIDVYAYRFAGFGFTFWAIAMLTGSIWAYQSWGRFWGWDPIETWSLITWIGFGLYLHLRRFFRLRGEVAAYFYIACFIISLVAVFFLSFIDTSVHSEYFK